MMATPKNKFRVGEVGDGLLLLWSKTLGQTTMGPTWTRCNKSQTGSKAWHVRVHQPLCREQDRVLSSGPNMDDQFYRCGGYVGRILHGAKPSDLPIQRPEKFDLVINLKTAD
jgi:hypothetical protein